MHLAAARERIGILVVDDDRAFADGLAAALADEDALAVCGHARDGEEAMRLFSSARPDLVLVDAAMPWADGAEAARRMRREVPGLPVIMLTSSSPSDDDIARATEVGVAGYVMKTTPADDLVSAAAELAALAKTFAAARATVATS